MPLTDEKAKQIKEQLIQQIQSSQVPEEQKSQIVKQVQGMNNQQLEAFIKQNNLMNNSEQENTSSVQQNTPPENCIFCKIASGQTQSFKIAEDETSLAVLELNPISRGHILIIPKTHITSPQELPEKTQSLSEKVSKIIEDKLKAKNVKLETNNVMGHESVNLIPVYDKDVSLNSERKQATREELQELYKMLSGEILETVESSWGGSKSSPEENVKSEQNECIMCSIIANQIKSYWIDENKKAIAVLNIKPESLGHVIVIPKEHIKESGKIPQQVFSLAKKISKKINTKLKPKDISITSNNSQGHEIVNVIPVYTEIEKEKNNPQNVTEKNLQEMKKKLEKKTKPSNKNKNKNKKKGKESKIKISKKWKPKRIP